MSIHPVNKAAEHLINSTPVGGGGGGGREREKKKLSMLIRNSKGDGGGGGMGSYYHRQSEGLGGVLCHSPSYATTSRCARSLRLMELND